MMITDTFTFTKNSFSFVRVLEKGFQTVRELEMGELSVFSSEKLNIKKTG